MIIFTNYFVILHSTSTCFNNTHTNFLQLNPPMYFLYFCCVAPIYLSALNLVISAVGFLVIDIVRSQFNERGTLSVTVSSCSTTLVTDYSSWTDVVIFWKRNNIGNLVLLTMNKINIIWHIHFLLKSHCENNKVFNNLDQIGGSLDETWGSFQVLQFISSRNWFKSSCFKIVFNIWYILSSI